MDKLTRKKAKEEANRISSLPEDQREQAKRNILEWFIRSSSEGHYPTRSEPKDIAKIILVILSLVILFFITT